MSIERRPDVHVFEVRVVLPGGEYGKFMADLGKMRGWKFTVYEDINTHAATIIGEVGRG